jgi:diphthamide biosynthesis methyltransferase
MPSKNKRKGPRAATGVRVSKRPKVLTLDEFTEIKMNDAKAVQLEYETYKTVNEVAQNLRKLISRSIVSDTRSDIESKCLEWTGKVLDKWAAAVARDYVAFDKVVCAH